jgi:hypothetical protein
MSEKKKAVTKTLLFLLVFVVINVLAKPMLMSLMAHAKPSSMKNVYDIATDCQKDIVIFGSSRAMHHYDSRIISDSLNMSCLNCGAMSNGIVLMYGRYKLLTRHHKPKIIIYDLFPPYDLQEDDNSKYIPTLRPFADDEAIRSLFSQIDKRENLKVYSALYRYNSLLPELVSANFKEDKSLYDGYAPLFNTKTFTPPTHIKHEDTKADFKYDTLKISLFREMILDCKRHNIELLFVISPSYYKAVARYATPVINICKEYHIPLLSYDNGIFPIENQYFYDSVHLNDFGAKYFTKMLVSDVKKYLN